MQGDEREIIELRGRIKNRLFSFGCLQGQTLQTWRSFKGELTSGGRGESVCSGKKHFATGDKFPYLTRTGRLGKEELER